MRIQPVIFSLLLILSYTVSAQSKKEIESLTTTSKNTIDIPLSYMCSFPTPELREWDKGYNAYLKYLTPAVMKTQLGMSFVKDGIQYWWIYPSAKPHVQLDTVTMINSKEQMYGTWRAVKSRRILFTDSSSYVADKVFRSDSLLAETQEDIFFVFNQKSLGVYAKETPEGKLKHISNTRYDIESKRYLMLYKVFKGGAGISLAGIDDKGRLIIHANHVEERKVPNNYIVYETIVDQMIFEKVK
ncbi:MAG TPA: hypothetical protein VK167_14065 [Flavipsychrobacter sp.]|nr:hypothetical protein [Flavipsychrobacter sp.]